VAASSIGTTNIAFAIDFACTFALIKNFCPFNIIGIAFFALKATNFCYSFNAFLAAFASFFVAAFASLSTFLLAFSSTSFAF